MAYRCIKHDIPLNTAGQCWKCSQDGNIEIIERYINLTEKLKADNAHQVIAITALENIRDQLQAELKEAREKLALFELKYPFFLPKCDIKFKSADCHPDCPHQEQCEALK